MAIDWDRTPYKGYDLESITDIADLVSLVEHIEGIQRDDNNVKFIAESLMAKIRLTTAQA